MGPLKSELKSMVVRPGTLLRSRPCRRHETLAEEIETGWWAANKDRFIQPAP